MRFLGKHIFVAAADRSPGNGPEKMSAKLTPLLIGGKETIVSARLTKSQPGWFSEKMSPQETTFLWAVWKMRTAAVRVFPCRFAFA
jgi:hypothetical protein